MGYVLQSSVDENAVSDKCEKLVLQMLQNNWYVAICRVKSELRTV